MNMRTPPHTLKKPRDQDFVSRKNRPADRANPFTFTVKTVHAAPDVHKPVIAAIRGGESLGAYQLAFGKLRGTDRASFVGVIFTGGTLGFWFWDILYFICFALLFIRSLPPVVNTRSGKK
jgi:hypothetical protein